MAAHKPREARTASFAAASVSFPPGSCARRTATGAVRRTRTPTWGSVSVWAAVATPNRNHKLHKPPSMMLPLIHHGMVMVGIPYSGSPMDHTQTGGTPYGASHVAGADNNNPLSDDEKTMARLLGRRVANAAHLLGGNPL